MHPLGVKFVFLIVSFFNNFAKIHMTLIYLNPFHLKSCFLFTNILYGLWFIYLRILICLEFFFSDSYFELYLFGTRNKTNYVSFMACWYPKIRRCFSTYLICKQFFFYWQRQSTCWKIKLMEFVSSIQL